MSGEEENTIYGPTLPRKQLVVEEKEEVDLQIGPALPTEKLLITTRTSYGPNLPGVFENVEADNDQEDSDDEDFGPMPIPKGGEDDEISLRNYRFALAEEKKPMEEKSAPKREDWMLTVPKTLGNIGLGPRTFKRSAVDTDKSWEDSPTNKKKPEEKKSVHFKSKVEDPVQKEIGPSFVQLHQKDRREQHKNKEEICEGRRPFDREKDMAVGGLKPGASKEAVERMKELGNRFTTSREAKYL
ncbi:unnamed protein product [Caenorhabditis auriculariae]|uniref:DUF3752 domain-containing protein n=1 Tax=Caenorhabditis auriculariae TaxID=2777116 RepID=A0A8S1HMA6_9PELO|nr:unnamed protein product [Caenorhabditis auriculariae]